MESTPTETCRPAFKKKKKMVIKGAAVGRPSDMIEAETIEPEVDEMMSKKLKGHCERDPTQFRNCPVRHPLPASR